MGLRLLSEAIPGMFWDIYSSWSVVFFFETAGSSASFPPSAVGWWRQRLCFFCLPQYPQHFNKVGECPSQRSGKTFYFIATYPWRLPVLVGKPAIHRAGSNLKMRVFLKLNLIRTSLMVQWISLPANAGDTGSIPDLGRFHMSRGSLWAPTTEARTPMCLEPVLCNRRSHSNEACAPQQSSHCCLQLEKVRAKQWRPSTAKNKKIKMK